MGRQVRDCLAKGDRARVTQIVQQLCSFLKERAPSHANARNGGLIGMAGVAIAVGQEVAVYLDEIIDPILACFSDPDAKTRYFACESFYNIAKVCKGEMLVYFNEVFVVIARLAADSEVSVKNGAELLDRLFKDIVCEAAPHYVSVHQDVAKIREKQDAVAKQAKSHQESPASPESAEVHQQLEVIYQQIDARSTSMNKAFSLPRLMPLLAERMQVISPLTRNYLVNWIAVLDSVPDLQLVSYLPVFLKYLFQYLADPNTDVGVATTEVLATFLREIRDAAYHVDDETNGCHKQDMRQSDESQQQEEQDEATDRNSEDDDLIWRHTRDVRVEYTAILEILLEQVSCEDEDIQATTFEWITELLQVIPSMVLSFTPRLVSAVLQCLAHPSPSISTAAIETNRQLFQAIESQSPSPSPNPQDLGESQQTIQPVPVDYLKTAKALKNHLLDRNDKTRLNALEWLIMLHRKSATELFSIEDESSKVLFKVLLDPSEEVVLCDLRLLTQVFSKSDARQFELFIGQLLDLFRSDPRLLETYGSLIIRQLCSALDAERVFCTLASSLESADDLDFASIMVQSLNLILVASPELAAFRRKLRALDQKENQTLFIGLYRCWCHNAVSVLCLCLMTQVYEHAYNVLRVFADLEVTLSMLIQIDKLVQLLESPIFTALRLQLLEPETHPFLYKCLYGLMMLLPQSSAFSTLRNRVHAVNGLGFMPPARNVGTSNASRPPRPSRNEIPWSELLSTLRQTQTRHEQARELRPEQSVSDAASLRDLPSASSTASQNDMSLVGKVRRRPYDLGILSATRSATAPFSASRPTPSEEQRPNWPNESSTRSSIRQTK
ncbi:hypothetical protein MPSI1_001671 [Malassezia psittaci]|uniref:Vacuolar protein 14 C-terminal Fig4-binding domain-containing protein n=1 Tax=Malassezia psittaci TaxID=1821823 RepID=A0AAF0JE07_9BASI|nr:hypothetical protein MPSI1_001671 [Malassezia psittaci]